MRVYSLSVSYAFTYLFTYFLYDCVLLSDLSICSFIVTFCCIYSFASYLLIYLFIYFILAIQFIYCYLS